MKWQGILGIVVIVALAAAFFIFQVVRADSIRYRFATAAEYYAVQTEDPQGLGKGGVVGGLLVPQLIPECATDIVYTFDIDQGFATLSFACPELDIPAYSAIIDDVNDQGLPWVPRLFENGILELDLTVPALPEQV